MRKCLPDHLKFGAFTPEDAKRWPELISKTSSTCVEQNLRKSMMLVPSPPQNQPKWCPGALRKRSSKQVGCGTPKKCQRHTLLGTFWAILVSILATTGRHGIPKSSIFAPGCAKISKHDIQNEASKKNEIPIEFCLENVSF